MKEKMAFYQNKIIMKYLLIFLMLFQSPCLAGEIYDTNNLLEKNYRIEKYSDQIKEEFGVDFNLYIDPLSSNEEILEDLPKWRELVFIVRTKDIQPSNNSTGRLYYYERRSNGFYLNSSELGQIIKAFGQEDSLDESLIDVLKTLLDIADNHVKQASLWGYIPIIIGVLIGSLAAIYDIIENERKNRY